MKADFVELKMKQTVQGTAPRWSVELTVKQDSNTILHNTFKNVPGKPAAEIMNSCMELLSTGDASAVLKLGV